MGEPCGQRTPVHVELGNITVEEGKGGTFRIFEFKLLTGPGRSNWHSREVVHCRYDPSQIYFHVTVHVREQGESAWTDSIDACMLRPDFYYYPRRETLRI